MTVYSTSKFIKAIEKKGFMRANEFNDGVMSERRKQIGLYYIGNNI